VPAHRTTQRVLFSKVVRVLEAGKIGIAVERLEIDALDVTEQDETAGAALLEALVDASEVFR
jgi:hypothetical protein